MSHQSYYNTSGAKKYFEIARTASSIFRQSREYKKIFSLMNSGDKICEFGCGEGSKLASFKSKEKKIDLYGIDISEEAISQAQENNSFLHLEVMSTESTTFEDGFFDTTMSYFVYEHLENPEKTFVEMLRVTKKGGNIVLMFPNFGSPLFPSPPSLYKLSILQKIQLIIKRIFSNKRNWYTSVNPITDIDYQSDYDTVSEIRMSYFLDYITSQYKIKKSFASSSWYQVGLGSNPLLLSYLPIKLLSYLGFAKYSGPTAFIIFKK